MPCEAAFCTAAISIISVPLYASLPGGNVRTFRLGPRAGKTTRKKQRNAPCAKAVCYNAIPAIAMNHGFLSFPFCSTRVIVDKQLTNRLRFRAFRCMRLRNVINRTFQLFSPVNRHFGVPMAGLEPARAVILGDS